jgi:hypothetical protein
MATAAIAFIGWTGSGTPKNNPVKILAIPEKTRVLEREMVPFTDSAMAMGRNVPRSPSEPDISATGWDLRMCRFRAEMSRKVLMNDIVHMDRSNDSIMFARCMYRREVKRKRKYGGITYEDRLAAREGIESSRDSM